MNRSVAFLALVAAPVLAAPPSAIPVQNAMRSFPGVSTSGNAIINESMRPDPQIQDLGRQSRSLHDQLNAAINGQSPDLDRVAALLRQGAGLDAQVRQRINDRVVGTARQLSPPDRSAFLRDLLNPQQGQQGMPQQR